MLKALGRLIAATLLLPVLVLGAILALAFFIAEDAPLVRRTAPADFATVDAGKALVKRIKVQIESADAEGATLEVTRRELGHLAQLGAHTFKWLDMDFEFQAGAIRSMASVHTVRIDGDTARLTVFPPPDVKAQLKQAVRTLQASRFPPGEEERVAHYYGLLVGFGGTRDGSPRSLSAYLIPLMAAAAQRSVYTDAVTENRAATWALVIYFSNGAFETLVGKLVSSQRPLVRSPYGVVLANRQDLMAHFLYSAGITLATQQGIGIAAGEFKELLDSGNGGSGFSFADLAADRAGIDFVNAATSSEESARELQQRVIGSKAEAGFFPDISGLAEGLSEEQFQAQYGSVESERYRAEVAAIDRRIARLRER